MGFYSITSTRASVNALATLGKPVKVIDDYDGKGVAISFPHVHTSLTAGVDPVVAGTVDVWRKALDGMDRERKTMGPFTIDDVRCFRDEWHELIAEIRATVKPEIPVGLPEIPALQFYSCSRALSDGRYSGLNRDITEKHGQWYVRTLKSAPYCTGNWCVFALQADATSTGEQSIVIRERSAQAAAEKAETILTAISLCF